MPSPLQCYMERWKDGCGAELCRKVKKVVHVRGTLPCTVAFVGEAPGESEDVLGYPFAGPAGHLMNEIIRRGVPDGVTYALMNLVGCIPREEGGGKATEPDVESIMTCAPRLQELLDMASPRLIVCVGHLARDWLKKGMKNPVTVPKEVVMMDIYHPAYIIRANVVQKAMLIQRESVRIASAISDLPE